MKILVSACLLGEPVRYDGRDNAAKVSDYHEQLRQWQQQGLLVPVCPESLGGLPTPRPAAEIDGGDGAAVLTGLRRIHTASQQDVTDEFVTGARHTLNIALKHQACCALLAARSPSCGSDSTYNGRFSGQLTSYMGVTAALLTQHGVRCFSPERFEQLQQYVNQQLSDNDKPL